MNLDLFKEKLISRTGKDIAWKDNSEDDEFADLSAEYGLDAFRYYVDLNVGLDKNSEFDVYITFSDINYTHDTLKLVNNFNLNVPSLKCLIKLGRRNKLIVSYSLFKAIDEDDAVDNVVDFLKCLEEKTTFNNLNPLVVLIKE